VDLKGVEGIVAVAVELENGKKRYFLTWGRLQNDVAYDPLEAIVLKHAGKFDLGGIPKKARICHTLQEASRQPFFFEYFFEMSQRGIPSGRGYRAWRKKIDKLMRRGKELYYLGNPRRNAALK
jgi:hypothetical protein